ncbi:MAG: UvrB/UvrC motif-containing protein [Treponema sp.]|nr:UvrB/UvrC motif-containing protein [Treponema sp.]
MVCDVCRKRQAAFFIEQVTKASSRTIHVCMQCAVGRGIYPDPKVVQRSIGALFSEIDKAQERLAASSEKHCPACGSALSEITQTGRTGCPECYAVFTDEIKKLMKSHGIAGPYTGSLPRRISGYRSLLTDRMDLQTKLEESLRNEEYEKAAVYRDYLRALDRKPTSSGDTDGGAAHE